MPAENMIDGRDDSHLLRFIGRRQSQPAVGRNGSWPGGEPA